MKKSKVIGKQKLISRLLNKFLVLSIISTMVFAILGLDQLAYADNSSELQWLIDESVTDSVYDQNHSEDLLSLFEYEENFSTILYVRDGSSGDGTSWADAFGTLQEALDAADTSSGQTYEIWMAAGTYVPTKDHLDRLYPDYARGRTFQLKNNVAIYGGFPATGNPSMAERNWEIHKTILSGDLNQDDTDNLEENKSDNVVNVFYHPATLSLDQTAILDGVTISGGYAHNTEESRRHGGGMYNGGIANQADAQNNPVLRNVHFTSNSSQLTGGALYNTGQSHVTMHHVTFSHNKGFTGGAIYIAGASLTIVDGVIHNNIAANSGAGIGTDNHSINNLIELTRVTIRDNTAQHPNNSRGGGIYISGGTLTMSEGSIDNNNARTGGGLYQMGRVQVTLDHVTISNNQANDGGGIYTDQSDQAHLMRGAH